MVNTMSRRALIASIAALALGFGAPGAVDGAQPPPPPSAPSPPAAPATPAAPAASPAVDASAYNWLRPDIAPLIAAGLWPSLAGADLGRDATQADLALALSIIAPNRPAPGGDRSAPVSVWAAHLAAVRALGLEPTRRALAQLSDDAGNRMRLPRNFGSEAIAHELGLVVNHPAEHEDLERARRQPIALGDLAYLTERARNLNSWEVERGRALGELRLPSMNPQQRSLVEAALAQVGSPYVWGGDWPGVRSPWGAQAVGGFDCSGLVWWSFKGAPPARRMAVGARLMGRTADDMAFERPTQRVALNRLRPADLVFFGPAGPRSKRGTISHMAISLGGRWIVHSSGSRGGVAISNLDTYWPSATALARRVPGLG